MKKIVITNVYGYKNIGDGAILDSAIKILDKTIPEKSIHIHAATLFSAKKYTGSNTKIYLHPYGIAVKTIKGPISNMKKILRFITVISKSMFYLILGKILPHALPDKGDYSYIGSLKEADVVLGIGGGYFRTKSKYKDYFGLLLTIFPIFIAHLYNKRILYLPMSYGNFASNLHDGIVFHTIKNDVIIFRDEISLNEFNKNSNKKFETYLIPDLALFDEYTDNKKHTKDYIVLTARLWMKKSKQKKYEYELARLVNYIWSKYKLKTIFIPMVWNEKEEDDKRVGIRIRNILKNKDIFTIQKINSPVEAKRILSQAKIAICTRMHSAILSTIVHTPFITIAYEYKTLGFLKHLGLEEWNIDIQNYTFSKIKEKVDDLLENKYEDFVRQLKINHRTILQSEDKLVHIVKDFTEKTNEYEYKKSHSKFTRGVFA